MDPLLTAAICILLLNIPFGIWRAGTKVFSARWCAAVHLPIPLAAGVRLLCGVGWHLSTLPVMIGAYFAGQYLGGLLRTQTRRGRT